MEMDREGAQAIHQEEMRGKSNRRIIQKLLCHASIRFTILYTRIGYENLRKAYDRAFPRANLLMDKDESAK